MKYQIKWMDLGPWQDIALADLKTYLQQFCGQEAYYANFWLGRVFRTIAAHREYCLSIGVRIRECPAA